MRFFFTGPRIFGLRPGISFGPEDWRRATRKTSSSITGSFVYVVRGDHNLTKIGITTNPTARLATLRTSSPFPIDYAFIGVTPGGGIDIERGAHALLSHQRLQGEWFDVPPELAIAALTGAAAKLGQPIQPLSLGQAEAALRIASRGDDNPPVPAPRWQRVAGGAVFILAVFVFLAFVSMAHYAGQARPPLG